MNSRRDEERNFVQCCNQQARIPISQCDKTHTLLVSTFGIINISVQVPDCLVPNLRLAFSAVISVLLRTWTCRCCAFARIVLSYASLSILQCISYRSNYGNARSDCCPYRSQSAHEGRARVMHKSCSSVKRRSPERTRHGHWEKSSFGDGIKGGDPTL